MRKMKILELGAQKIDAFKSIIENAECNGKKGLPGKLLTIAYYFQFFINKHYFSALVESMGLDNAIALMETLKGHVEKEDNLRSRIAHQSDSGRLTEG